MHLLDKEWVMDGLLDIGIVTKCPQSSLMKLGNHVIDLSVTAGTTTDVDFPHKFINL